MKRMLLVLIMGVAIMTIPILASADYYTDWDDWEAAVGGIYLDMVIPGDDGDIIPAYTRILLPYGEYIRFNEPLERIDDGGTELLVSDTLIGDNYYARANFYPDLVSSTPGIVSAFGFWVEPLDDNVYKFLLYTAAGGEEYQWINGSEGPGFYGWVGEDVTGFSLICYTPGALGIEMSNFVEGSTAVPEPSTMLLLGFGLIGLWGARKKLKK